MARTRTWVVENTWVCSSCRAKNRGRDMACSSCGSPKERDEAYDTSGNLRAPAVTDTTMLAEARAGANWTCSYCRQDNRALLQRCERCGAEREVKSASASQHAAVSSSVAGGSGRLDELGDDMTMPLSLRERIRRFFAESPRRNAIVGVGVAVLIVAALLWYFVVPHEVVAQVTATSWRYTRVLEQRETRSGSGWGSPPGAFNVSCDRRFRTTEQCNPHECNCHSVTDYCSRPCNCHEVCSTSCTDNGNGYSSCTETCSDVCSTCEESCGSHQECDTCYDQCDVYDDWCTYDYYAWPEIDREVTSGSGPETSWGSRLVADESEPSPQRIRQTEEYEIAFTRDHDSWAYEPDSLSSYQRYRVGERWRIAVNRVGTVRPVRIEPN